MSECLLTEFVPWLEGLLTYLGWMADDPSELARSLAERLFPTDPAERVC